MPLSHLAVPLISLAEAGRLPDGMVRAGMRQLIAARQRELTTPSIESQLKSIASFVEMVSEGPIAAVPEKANEQHYEVPADFFVASLGAHLKYSCCYWDEDTDTLEAAERNALIRTCENADLSDGQEILELGCGWGSLSLWMAEHYPSSKILAVSNSASQKAYIDSQAAVRNLTNLEVQTADINSFSTSRQFDRVVSVEMFEHVRNHRELLRRIGTWLNDDGKLFVHIFCHHSQPYLFLDEGPANWMTRFFFSGGMMPSRDLLLRYQSELSLEHQTCWDGTHYEKTSNAWLQAMDANKAKIRACFSETYGEDWKTWVQRWRMFYMASAELFGFNHGREWYVSHYRFTK